MSTQLKVYKQTEYLSKILKYKNELEQLAKQAEYIKNLPIKKERK